MCHGAQRRQACQVAGCACQKIIRPCCGRGPKVRMGIWEGVPASVQPHAGARVAGPGWQAIFSSLGEGRPQGKGCRGVVCII